MPTYDSLARPHAFKNGVADPLQLASADGAITAKGGTVLITKGSAAALTLAAPVAGDVDAFGDDGRELVILSTTAFAHTVTNASPGFNNNGASSDVATFGAAKGNAMLLRAYAGAWYVVASTGVTLG